MPDQKESKKTKAVLSAKGWRDAARLITTHKYLFTRTASELAVIDYVLDRTLQYHKFDEWFMTREWLEGRHKLRFFGAGFHRSSILRSLEKLTKRNLLEVIGYDREWSRYHIVINVPGILEQLQSLDAVMNASACTKIKSMVLKTKEYFMEQGWRSSMAHRLDDVEEMAREASQEAKLRKKEKRDAKDLKVGWIYGEMMSYAEECEVPFSDVWIKKTYGQARNWLGECQALDKNPRELLYDAVNFWPEIAESLKPKNTFIGGAAGWTVYYKYRRQIEEQLAINKEIWENDRRRTSKIVYLPARAAD